MGFKVFLAVIIACSFICRSSAECEFSTAGPDVYICTLSNVAASNSADVVNLSGTHIGGRTNNDVTQVIVISPSSIEEIPTNIFTTFPNLEYFIIENNSVRKIELTNCGLRVKEVRINGNQVPILQNGAFRGCSSIEVLHLIANNFNEIEEGAFDGLPNLIELTMFINLFPVIRPNLFRYQTQLEYLRIDQNGISTIDGGAFQYLANVHYLDLIINNLETILAGTFTNIPNLVTLNIRINRIRFIELGAFANLPYLQTINLSDNELTVLDSGIFATQMPRMQIMHLYANYISAVDRNFFGQIPSIRNFHIQGNPCLSDSSGDFTLIESLENEVFPYMQVCFNNFDLLSTQLKKK